MLAVIERRSPSALDIFRRIHVIAFGIQGRKETAILFGSSRWLMALTISRRRTYYSVQTLPAIRLRLHEGLPPNPPFLARGRIAP